MVLKPFKVLTAKAALDAKMFANLEVVWKKNGRMPTSDEMRGIKSDFSIEAYSQRFGSWLRACEAFILYRRREKGSMQFKNPINPNKRGMPKQPKHISTFPE